MYQYITRGRRVIMRWPASGEETPIIECDEPKKAALMLTRADQLNNYRAYNASAWLRHRIEQLPGYVDLNP